MENPEPDVTWSIVGETSVIMLHKKKQMHDLP